MTSSLRVAVVGAAGRMGGAIIRLLTTTPGLQLVAAVDRPGSSSVGQDAGALAGVPSTGVRVQDQLAAALATSGAQVVIDFSSPQSSPQVAETCARAQVAVVIGSTGLDPASRERISAAAGSVPVVMAPNMSVGVNVLFKIVEDVTRALGTDYQVDVLEAHHRLKKDAPSGTALRLADAVAAGREGPSPLRHAREGLIGERPPEEIGMAVLRGGDVVGEHTVYFFGEGERVELTHRATSRDQFARGALRAAQWLAGRAPGLYDMQDVLGLRGVK